eukprot:403338567
MNQMTQNIDSKDKNMNFPSFENLPVQFRKALKDDIIITVVQNMNELTPVPREWKLNIDRHAIAFNKIYLKQAKQDRQTLSVLKEINCYMYHPQVRTLIPTQIKIFTDNAKYISNEFEKIKKNTVHPNFDPNKNYKKRMEHYDFLKVNLFDGLISDKTAYDTLVKKYGCNSDKISHYNILKLRSHEFERIFVFYRDDQSKSPKDNQLEGEKKLEKFIKALKLLCKILSQHDETLFGQMAEIKELKKPEASIINFNDLKKQQQNLNKRSNNQLAEDNKNGNQKSEIDQKYKLSRQNITLNRHYLQDIEIEELYEYVIENNDGDQEDYIKIKLDLRFSNQESSKPLSILIDGKRSEFWKQFESSLAKVNMKPTDLNFLKKQSKEKLKPRLEEIKNEIQEIYDQLENIEQIYEANLERGKKDAVKEYHQNKKSAECQLAKKMEEQREVANKRMTLKRIKRESRLRLQANALTIGSQIPTRNNNPPSRSETPTGGSTTINLDPLQQPGHLNDQQLKVQFEKELDSYISHKKIKLISKDNFENIDPLVEIQDLLLLQDLNIKIRGINVEKVRSRGVVKRGGKNTKKVKQKRQRQIGKNGDQKSKSQPPSHRQDQQESTPDQSLPQLNKFESLLIKFRSVSQMNEKEEEKKRQEQESKQRNKQYHNGKSMYKKGSRANWDLGHRKYVKSIIGVKEYVNQENKRVENRRQQQLNGIKESQWEHEEDEWNEDWETPGDTPNGFTPGGPGFTKGYDSGNINDRMREESKLNGKNLDSKWQTDDGNNQQSEEQTPRNHVQNRSKMTLKQT